MQTRISNAEHPSEVVILLEASVHAYDKDVRLFDANAGRAVMAAKRAFDEGKGITILSNSRDEERLSIRAGDRKALRLAEDQACRYALRWNETVICCTCADRWTIAQRCGCYLSGCLRGGRFV